MFLFRSYQTEKKFEDVENIEEVKKVEEKIESVYVISLNGEPVCFKKDTTEVFSKVDEMRDKLKFDLVCNGSKVFDEFDYDKEHCSIYSRGMNAFMGGETLEYLISWKKVSNE